MIVVGGGLHVCGSERGQCLTVRRSWWRYYATGRNVAGSISDGIIGFFHEYQEIFLVLISVRD